VFILRENTKFWVNEALRTLAWPRLAICAAGCGSKRCHFSRQYRQSTAKARKTVVVRFLRILRAVGKATQKVVPKKSQSDTTYKRTSCSLEVLLRAVIDRRGQGGRSVRASRGTGDGVRFSSLGHEITHRSQTGRLLGDRRVEG